MISFLPLEADLIVSSYFLKVWASISVGFVDTTAREIVVRYLERCGLHRPRGNAQVSSFFTNMVCNYFSFVAALLGLKRRKLRSRADPMLLGGKGVKVKVVVAVVAVVEVVVVVVVLQSV